MWDILLDFVFPRRSLGDEEGQFITGTEILQLHSVPVVLEQPALRKTDLKFLDRVVAAADYRSVPLLKRAIHTYKYKRIPQLSTALAAELISASRLLTLDDAVFAPVPLHWSRLFARGFNQAQLLVEAVGKSRGVPVHHVLRRIRATGHQARRKREERFNAMQDAFRCVEHSPPKVILIDDVFTTGATLDMCAKALKAAGAERVEALVLARG